MFIRSRLRQTERCKKRLRVGIWADKLAGVTNVREGGYGWQGLTARVLLALQEEKGLGSERRAGGPKRGAVVKRASLSSRAAPFDLKKVASGLYVAIGIKEGRDQNGDLSETKFVTDPRDRWYGWAIKSFEFKSNYIKKSGQGERWLEKGVQRNGGDR